MTQGKSSILKQRLASGRIVVAPGIYDMVSVRIADRMGFDSLYMTGFGTVASARARPICTTPGRAGSGKCQHQRRGEPDFGSPRFTSGRQISMPGDALPWTATTCGPLISQPARDYVSLRERCELVELPDDVPDSSECDPPVELPY